jgi:hypothetical protein
MAEDKDRNNDDGPLPKGATDAQIEAKRELLLAEKYGGDPRKMLMATYKDGVIIKKKYDELLQRTVPKDHVTIPKADLDLLGSYRKLGDPKDLEASLAALESYKAIGDPAAVKAAVEELPALKEDLVRQKRQEQLSRLAEIRGYQPSVLALAPGVSDGMEFVVAEITDDRGEVTKSIEVKDTDDKGKPRTRKIEEVEAADWKDLMPALRPDAPKADERREPARRELPIGTGGYQGGDQPRRTVSDRDREEDTGRRIAARRIGYGQM